MLNDNEDEFFADEDDGMGAVGGIVAAILIVASVLSIFAVIYYH